MANTGRKVYPFLRQVNANTLVPTGLIKANVPGDPDYVPPVVDYVHCPVVAWQAIAPFCATAPVCPTGWTLSPDGSQCTKISSQASVPPSGSGGSPGIVERVTNNQWNEGGALLFAPGFNSDGSGTVVQALIVPHFWVNGATVWSTATRNNTDSRMNAAGIWVSGHSDGSPYNEFIGFSRKITTLAAKRVYVGIAGDNTVRITLNGTELLTMTNQLGGANFNYWSIYPIDLIEGDNYVEVFGSNSGGPAGFAAEIYDNTQAQLIAATSVGDLNIIFTTSSLAGQPFDLGQTIGYSCAPGWALDTSGGGVPVCRLVQTQAPVLQNTGFKGFATRARLTAGALDGYQEPNTNGGGLGPYFSPVQDLINCPLPINPPPPNPPTLVQINNVSLGLTRTQVFQVGASVNLGNRFQLIVYSHTVEVIATGTDTPTSIAAKLAAAINATTPTQWNDHASAPAGGTPGFPPSASASGDKVTVVLNNVNQFASNAQVS